MCRKWSKWPNMHDLFQLIEKIFPFGHFHHIYAFSILLNENDLSNPKYCQYFLQVWFRKYESSAETPSAVHGVVAEHHRFTEKLHSHFNNALVYLSHETGLKPVFCLILHKVIFWLFSQPRGCGKNDLFYCGPDP